MNHTTEMDVWKALETIHDPEVPVLSLVDMKIIHSVEVQGDEVIVEITPTFVGCPALDMIAESVRDKMLSLGFKSVHVNKTFVAQWSTDMLEQPARDKLEQFGIAPPTMSGTIVLEIPILCPFCKSSDTKIESPFGATLCKQLCYCNSCKQSFEKFRTI